MLCMTLAPSVSSLIKNKLESSSLSTAEAKFCKILQSKSVGFEHDNHFGGSPYIFKHTETACRYLHLKDQEASTIILLGF